MAGRLTLVRRSPPIRLRIGTTTSLARSRRCRRKLSSICSANCSGSGLTDIALAGGGAMNSVANRKVRRMTRFRRVYVQSAASDAGGAIGAAFAVWHARGGGRSFGMDYVYWGPKFGEGEVTALLAERAQTLRAAGCTVEKIDNGGEKSQRDCAAAAAPFSRNECNGFSSRPRSPPFTRVSLTGSRAVELLACALTERCIPLWKRGLASPAGGD